MTAKDLEEKVFQVAEEYGAFTQLMKEKSARRGTPNTMKRSNIASTSFKDGGAYFGFVRPEEAPSGAYYDLSFAIFPQEDDGKCVISLGVGSAGYQRDYELASTAGTRRLYTQLTECDGYSFVKNDFTDINSPLKDLIDKINSEDELNPLCDVISKYSKVILAARIVDPNTEFDVIEAWLAQYAKLRNWGTKAQVIKQNKALAKCLHKEKDDIQKDIRKLLKSRRYVILQGAPGTGKTYNALEISKEYTTTHFIQFHAETTYADFVEGMRPKVNSGQLEYELTKGELVKAIESARNAADGERVLLIIDEINRANLANVLGPVFYLFENLAKKRTVTLKIAGIEIAKLPENLDVIATMNTADRSLAVVDFALRRRFAWYTIRPQKITPLAGQKFHENLFNRFCEIFNRFATDEELNLQPGPSYFLTPDGYDANEIMKERMIYELMPLVKEYLAEGLMRKASDSFAQLFFEETKKFLYE